MDIIIYFEQPIQHVPPRNAEINEQKFPVHTLAF